MKNALRQWPRISARLGKKRRTLLLDFDGTLAAIAPTPSAVRLDAPMKQLLRRIAGDDAFRTAVISGRSLRDVVRRFPGRGIWIFGNHGLELRGPKLRLPVRARQARRLEGRMRRMKKTLADAVLGTPGAFVEDKGLTLSVHFRLVPTRHLPAFRAKMARCQRIYGRWPLVWKKGKKVWELRPDLRWDKGDAAEFFAAAFRGVPIVLGDDRTDEDMFRRLRKRGISVHVGRSRSSAAEYRLASPYQVRRFLERMLEHES